MYHFATDSSNNVTATSVSNCWYTGKIKGLSYLENKHGDLTAVTYASTGYWDVHVTN